MGMGQKFGDYELLRHIATGGMAEIHLARHLTGLDRTLVIKRMLPELAVRPDFVEMFLDEARLTASLQHPHVVRVEELGQVDGTWFIAMELVDGPHLGGLFANSLRSRKPLPIELCTFIVARAADGLDYAHGLNDPATGRPLNLVHRDISPQNILVSRHGEVKVTDFGVAKSSTQQTKTRTGIVKGKVSYMSPEQCLGETIDHRTDVFALGVVLYELLTRRRLFREKSDLLVMQRITNEDVPPPSTVNNAIDPALDAIVKKSIERNAARRYQTAADFAEALDAWLMKSGRQADELTLSQWFAANCPELAPTTTLGPAEPTVTATFAPPAPPEATAATPSFATRGGQRETTRLPPAPGSEATTITAPPSFDTAVGDAPAPPDGGQDGRQTLETSAPLPPAPRPSTSTPSPAPPATAAPRRHLPLVAAAVAVLVLVGVAFGLSSRRDQSTPPPPPTPSTTTTPTPEPMATLIIETRPPGIPIVVGDRVVGPSPVTVPRAAGLVIVQAQFPGQPVQEREVAVPATGEVRVLFEARVPLIIRSSPPRAKVRVGGELLGETPFDRGYLVEPGVKLAIRLEPPAPAWQVVEREVVVVPGSPIELDVELPPAAAAKRPVPVVEAGTGRLSIRTDPPVLVSLGKEQLDETPFAERQVKAGKHVLVLKNAEKGLDDRLPVTIVKDKTLVVILKYVKEGSGWKLQSKTIR